MTSFLGGIFIIEWYKYRKINYALTSIYSLDYKTIVQNYNWDALEKNSIPTIAQEIILNHKRMIDKNYV